MSTALTTTAQSKTAMMWAGAVEWASTNGRMIYERTVQTPLQKGFAYSQSTYGFSTGQTCGVFAGVVTLLLLAMFLAFTAVRCCLKMQARWLSKNKYFRKRRLSHSNRSLRDAISGKSPFEETLRQETVIYKMGSAFSIRQRRGKRTRHTFSMVSCRFVTRR